MTASPMSGPVGKVTTVRVPDVTVEPWTKGFAVAEATPGTALIGESLFGGAFTFPVMVAYRDALDHNIATLAAFAREHGLELAPHAKTTMAPALLAAQEAAGAWGFTVATPSQAMTLRRFGVRRLLLANEPVDPAGLRFLAAELDRDPDFELLCYADSAEGVALLSAHAGRRPFRVLAELGYYRTGARDLDALLAVAAAVRAAPGVELAGVAGYEGGYGTAEEVAGYTARLVEALARAGGEVLSVGGSAWFDVIADTLAGCDAVKILRSGCYVTHDHGLYAASTPYTRIPGELRPALEVWAHVLSAPEPGVAVCGLGRRDAPFDAGMPVPLRVRRADGTLEPVTGASVTLLQDQHAVLSGAAGLRPGELVAFGISHPCTAMDKWRILPVVDDDHTVVDVIATYF